jgi:hypothetical protein
MKLSRLMLACVLPLSLAGCGIPDLVAHGVKEFDKTQRKGEVQPAAAPAARQPRPEPAVVQEAPPPIYSGPSAPVARDSITVETLPPPK